MAYLQSVITDKNRIQGDNMFTPKWQPALLEKAAKMEVWCSSFSEPGGDYTKFILKDASDKQLAEATMGGY